MQNEENVLIDECCKHYSIESSFVYALNERGLIELMQANETYHIRYDQLHTLEKYMHFYYDLDINMEGIEAISHLLQKIDKLQAELLALKNEVHQSNK